MAQHAKRRNQYLSLSDYALAMGFTYNKVYRLNRLGRLRGARRIGGQWRVRPEPPLPARRRTMRGYMTVPQLAEKVEVSESCVYHWRRLGLLRCEKQRGSRYFFPMQERPRVALGRPKKIN